MSGVRSEIRIHRSIAEIGKAAWDVCAFNAEYRHNPFVCYDFLSALEESGAASPETGWAPHHLSVWREDGEIAGVAPLYLKPHSFGEYVFDHAWAEAYRQAGGRYYPKLQCASPFSPVAGPRLIGRPGPDRDEARKMLLRGAVSLCERSGVSSVNVTFPSEDDWRLMGQEGLLLRQDQQYHWFNRGYRDFEDFLAALSSGRRKTIRRERREAATGLDIVRLSGDALEPEHWDAFYGFYMDTGARKWGRPYLNRRFFALLGERMADKVVLVMARRDGRWIAGALNLLGDDCLYGRHWGCVEDAPFLHFELCYYQAVEEAIRRGLDRVEAGAQGEHKIARGYLPVPVYSAHHIADPALRAPVARYLDAEREAVRTEMDLLAEEYSPFRKDGS